MLRPIVLIISAFILFIPNSHATIWGESVGLNDLSDQRTFSSKPDYNPDSSQGGLKGNWPHSFTVSWDIDFDLNSKIWHYEYSLSASKKDISHFILELSDSAQLTDIMNIKINGQPSSVEGPKEWMKAGNQTLPNPFYGIKFDKGGDSLIYSFDTTLDPVWGNFYVRGGREVDHDGDDDDDEDRDDERERHRHKDRDHAKDRHHYKDRDGKKDRDHDKDRKHGKHWDNYKVWSYYNREDRDDDKFYYTQGEKHKGKDKDMRVHAYNNALGMDDFESDDKIDFIVRPNGGGNPPVVPEPISSILFIAGGATLGFRRFWMKRRTNSCNNRKTNQ